MKPKRSDPHILNKFDLTGQTAVVTGGAGLLGAEFCRTLAQAGAKVVIADFDIEAAQSLNSQLAGSGFTTLASQFDAREPLSVQRLVSSTLETFETLDILVNSAALDPKFDTRHLSTAAGEPSSSPASASFESFPLEAWKQALDTNLTGVYLCCQSAVKPMLAQGSGVIINISSIYGISGPDEWCP